MRSDITQVQELNVYTVVFHNYKVLILKRPNGIWEFPGGGVDFGEQPLQSAYRELKEETDLNAKNLSFLGVTSATFQKGSDEKHAVYLVYKGEAETDKVTISGEHTEFRWLTKEELKFLKLGLNAEQALEFL